MSSPIISIRFCSYNHRKYSFPLFPKKEKIPVRVKVSLHNAIFLEQIAHCYEFLSENFQKSCRKVLKKIQKNVDKIVLHFVAILKKFLRKTESHNGELEGEKEGLITYIFGIIREKEVNERG